MRSVAVCVCAGLLACGVAVAGTSRDWFPGQDAWVDVPGTTVSCSWQRQGVDFVSCDLRGAGDRLAATISHDQLAVFRFTAGGNGRLVRQWRHAAAAPAASDASPARSRRTASDARTQSSTFPRSGRYLRVPGTSIGCASGSVRAQRLVLCHLGEVAGRYAFALGETSVTVLRFPADGRRPVVVWARKQPGS